MTTKTNTLQFTTKTSILLLNSRPQLTTQTIHESSDYIIWYTVSKHVQMITKAKISIP